MPVLTLQSIRESGLDLYHLVCTSDTAWRESFHTPGQFIAIEHAGAKAYFALASSPSAKEVELLVKRQREPASALTRLQAGATIEASDAAGDGFPLAELNNRDLDLHLLSMGSGIAPLRSLILYSIAGRFSARNITLWQGSFTQAHLPFRDEYAAWRAAGIEVHLCLDQEHDPLEDHWAYPGTVAEDFRQKAAAAADPERTAFLWIGSEQFGAAVQELADELHLPPERVRSNI